MKAKNKLLTLLIVSVKEIFKEIHKGTIEVLITEEGIKIPITYKFEE